MTQKSVAHGYLSDNGRKRNRSLPVVDPLRRQSSSGSGGTKTYEEWTIDESLRDVDNLALEDEERVFIWVKCVEHHFTALPPMKVHYGSLSGLRPRQILLVTNIRGVWGVLQQSNFILQVEGRSTTNSNIQLL
jgi:hypothetical protein